MRKFDELKNDKDNLMLEIKNETEKLNILSQESDRVSQVAKNVNIIITDLDKQFESATKLNKTDITFLFFAVTLQCIRQYVIGKITQRTDDKTAAKNTIGHTEEHSNRSHKLYNPDLNEIITNPVPFDTNFGSKIIGAGVGGGFEHRAKTLGHDPLLGWVFGTMNIATSTMTLNNFVSYHILTGTTASGANRDMIAKHADTFKILHYSKEKLLNQGIDGKMIMGASVIKEAVHLKSDMYSKVSLPVPVISTVSPEFAKKLAIYGVDMGNIIKVSSQAAFAALINSLIAMIHGLFYDETQYPNMNMYAVKTRKILSYSNLIASLSNIIAVAIAAGIGVASDNAVMVKKSLDYLDLGGIMVTIYRIVQDHQFIKEIKQEFLENEFYKIVMG